MFPNVQTSCVYGQAGIAVFTAGADGGMIPCPVMYPDGTTFEGLDTDDKFPVVPQFLFTEKPITTGGAAVTLSGPFFDGPTASDVEKAFKMQLPIVVIVPGPSDFIPKQDRMTNGIVIVAVNFENPEKDFLNVDKSFLAMMGPDSLAVFCNMRTGKFYYLQGFSFGILKLKEMKFGTEIPEFISRLTEFTKTWNPPAGYSPFIAIGGESSIMVNIPGNPAPVKMGPDGFLSLFKDATPEQILDRKQLIVDFINRISRVMSIDDVKAFSNKMITIIASLIAKSTDNRRIAEINTELMKILRGVMASKSSKAEFDAIAKDLLQEKGTLSGQKTRMKKTCKLLSMPLILSSSMTGKTQALTVKQMAKKQAQAATASKVDELGKDPGAYGDLLAGTPRYLDQDSDDARVDDENSVFFFTPSIKLTNLQEIVKMGKAGNFIDRFFEQQSHGKEVMGIDGRNLSMDRSSWDSCRNR